MLSARDRDAAMRCMEKIEYLEDGVEKVVRAEKESFQANFYGQQVMKKYVN